MQGCKVTKTSVHKLPLQGGGGGGGPACCIVRAHVKLACLHSDAPVHVHLAQQPPSKVICESEGGRGDILTVRLMTRAPAGGIMISGTLKILPPRPPSFFQGFPPYLLFMRSAMSRASSMCCF